MSSISKQLISTMLSTSWLSPSQFPDLKSLDKLFVVYQILLTDDKVFANKENVDDKDTEEFVEERLGNYETDQYCDSSYKPDCQDHFVHKDRITKSSTTKASAKVRQGSCNDCLTLLETLGMPSPHLNAGFVCF